MSRQEEAEDLLLKLVNHKTRTQENWTKAQVYADKYLKPKDLLFEMFEAILPDCITRDVTKQYVFNQCKKLFEARGLDEAIEAYGLNTNKDETRTIRNIIIYLEVIKKGLE